MDNLIDNKGHTGDRFTLSKPERLCSKKFIDKLFLEGTTVFVYPLKIVFLEVSLHVMYPAQVGFSVSKRNFKSAVARNFIKRKMRETYRLNKPLFYTNMGEKQVVAFFIYTGKTLPDYSVVESAMKKALKRIVKEVFSNHEI